MVVYKTCHPCIASDDVDEFRGCDCILQVLEAVWCPLGHEIKDAFGPASTIVAHDFSSLG